MVSELWIYCQKILRDTPRSLLVLVAPTSSNKCHVSEDDIQLAIHSVPWPESSWHTEDKRERAPHSESFEKHLCRGVPKLAPKGLNAGVTHDDSPVSCDFQGMSSMS